MGRIVRTWGCRGVRVGHGRDHNGLCWTVDSDVPLITGVRFGDLSNEDEEFENENRAPTEFPEVISAPDSVPGRPATEVAPSGGPTSECSIQWSQTMTLCWMPSNVTWKVTWPPITVRERCVAQFPQCPERFQHGQHSCPGRVGPFHCPGHS